ncbi:MAG: hypothetical protein KF732_11660 [Flavobacteriales bacterium]|nr:hypothetical protein [Flavobacteriales bacterium]MBX2960598.1 hypothetical protein [Flavobacteriales bacterium]
MIFKINKSQTVTDKQNISANKIILNPFESNIIGLKICLYNANGHVAKFPITETNKPFSKDVSSFSSINLECSSSDKEYSIEFNLS